MAKIFNSIIETIGNTPIVKLNKVIGNTKHQFYAKIEYFNPGGSVKDRVALNFILEAERRGELKPGGTIVEATSGNTGVGLAMIASLRGYKCIFVMPEKISEEKRALLRGFGAKVIITPGNVDPEDPRSYISIAKTLVRIIPNSFCSNQYHNPDNVSQHYNGTGPELYEQMDGNVDVFVAGAGTGGTISGVGKFLKEKNSNIKIICADPIGSILYDLYYHKKIMDPPQPYKVEGVGEDMLPDNTHLDIMDGFEKVSDREAFQMARRLTLEEGLCVGPSSALALVGAMKFAEKLDKPSKILVLFPDNGRGYLSKAFNDQWMFENGFIDKVMDQKIVSSLIPTLERKVRVSLQVHSSVRESYEAMKINNCNEILIYEKENLLGLVKLDHLLDSLVSGKLTPMDSVIHLVKSSINFIDKDAPLEKVLEMLSDNKDIVLKNGDHNYIIDKRDIIELLL